MKAKLFGARIACTMRKMLMASAVDLNMSISISLMVFAHEQNGRKTVMTSAINNRTTERFTAEYEGQGFFSFYKDGWPDYVTMSKGSDVIEEAHNCKNYISSDIFEGMRLFYENEIESRSKRIYELHAEVNDFEGKIRDLCVAEDEDRVAYEARIAALEELVWDLWQGHSCGAGCVMYDECHPFNSGCLMRKRVNEINGNTNNK